MSDYVEILDTQIEPDAPLTAVLAGQWRDNCIAIAEGADGAPRVVRGALKTATASASGSIDPTGTVRVDLNQYSFFPDMRLGGSAVIRGDGSASATTPGFNLLNTSGEDPAPYSVAWRYIDE